MKIAHRFTDLFNDKIWTLDTSLRPKSYTSTVQVTKIVRTTFITFARNRMGFQCVALGYFIALATVPLVAFIFAITGGLGIDDRLYNFIDNLPISADMTNFIMEKAKVIIDSAMSGPVGLVSALTFLWTILWMMFQVERVFNNVWGIRKIPRKTYVRFGFYFLVLILIPFLVIIFGFGIALYSNATRLIGFSYYDLRFLPKLLGYIIVYIITTLTFSVMYKYIPAAKVRYGHALISAAIAAVFFIVFQYIYLKTQVFVGRLNATYGVLAAIPLFLIWLNFSWQIIIYGAQLCYSLHYPNKNDSPDWETDLPK